MISYIEGRVIKIYEDSLVVLTEAGIGFRVFVPRQVLREVNSIGHEIYLNTYFQVKEDQMALYGFLEDSELDCFNALLNVSGVGPKLAMAVLSTLSVEDISFAIISGDAKTISTAPGVGRKMAEKIIVELKDSFEKRMERRTEATLPDTERFEGARDEYEAMCLEAAQALTALGASMTDALKSVRSVPVTEDMTSDYLIREALKNI